jgi:maleylpyruvate isomerase
MSPTFDAPPPGQVADLLARVDTATAGFLRTAARISDQQARAASLLPGWSRGHVLTHVARNADSLRNLLIWAHTGVATPQYASQTAREEDIAAGHDRPAAELLADLAQAAAAFAEQAAVLSGAEWHAEVRGLRGPPHPAWFTLQRRLTELEVHHVDLDAGYGPADWPPHFAAGLLDRVAEDFSDADSPGAELRSSDSGAVHRIGPPETEPTLTITGPTYELLAWLIGRSAGENLATKPAGPLPTPPAW